MHTQQSPLDLQQLWVECYVAHSAVQPLAAAQTGLAALVVKLEAHVALEQVICAIGLDWTALVHRVNVEQAWLLARRIPLTTVAILLCDALALLRWEVAFSCRLLANGLCRVLCNSCILAWTVENNKGPM